MKTVAIIVPIFNELETIKLFYNRLKITINSIKDHHFIICFIDDGSSDKSSEVVKEIIDADNRVKLIILTRNFGKEAALSAGLNNIEADAVIPMDVDLQDPPELIKEMISIWSSGVPLVLARRLSRKEDTIFKRFSADIFYYIHNKLSSIKIPKNVGDFRLMDKSVVDSVKLLPEKERFMKGIFAWVGYDFHIIDYERPKRSSGETKFKAIKLFRLAKDGLFSFSLAPLKISSFLGYLGAISSLIYGAIIIVKTLYYGVDLEGYASLMAVILFIGSVNLIVIGILGEYIGRIFIEAKNRPIYLVKNVIEKKKNK
ncbi:glycosyltransferase family 2 protein [Methylophilaceae bacterium]|jgi:polyisoprenyl-phosphate glycosyltransferase|nr:glycosyltransferase family 2 protein [Methylophilaceae bacterium]